MSALVRAELTKIRTARALLAAPLVAVAYAVLTFGPALTMSPEDRRGLDGDSLLHIARGPGFAVAFVMLLLGILATAGEFRHGTVEATLLVAPRRRRVMAAKAIAVTIVAAVTALVVEAVAVSLGVLFLRANDVGIDVGAADIALTTLGTVLAAGAYGLIGVGLAAVVRDQTASVGAALLWVGIVEGAVPTVLHKPWLFRWLPGGAANSLLGIADPPPDLLPAGVAALLLAAVTGLLLVAGTTLFTTRDVTS